VTASAAGMEMKKTEIQDGMASSGNPMKTSLHVEYVIDDSPHFFDDIIAG
jgi:hypothetical protein